MAIDRTNYNALVDDDGTDTVGTIWTKNQIKIVVLDAIDALIGEWTDVAFAAGNFTGNGAMTWTVTAGEVQLNRYMKINKLLIWHVQIALTTVGGTPNTQLLIAVPTGTFASTGDFMRAAYCVDNNALVEAYVEPVDATHLSIQKTAGGNWAASTLLTSAYFTFIGQLA